MSLRTATYTLAVLMLFAPSLAFSQSAKIDSYFGLKAKKATSIQSTTKVSKLSSKILSIGKTTTSEDEGVSDMLDVFVKATDASAARQTIEKAGGSIHTQTGGVITASISAEALEEVSSSPAIDFIEAGKPVATSNNIAIEEINAKEAQSGTNLPAGYTGKGVIVGIIDTGIDYTHPDFYDATGKSRIISIWSQTRTQGPSPSEIENSFGTECKSDSIADGSCPLRDVDGHGTHVTGTAAGKSMGL